MSFNNLHAWANQPWESKAEEIAAFAAKRYSDPHDQPYRDAVARKTALTMGLDPDSSIRISNSGPNQIYVSTNDASNFEEGITELTTPGATPAELQEYSDFHADNPMALNPSLKIQSRVPPKSQAPARLDLSPEQQKAFGDTP